MPSPTTVLSPSAAPVHIGVLDQDRFGVVTDAWPTASSATASWGGQLEFLGGVTAADMLVARRDERLISDGVRITVLSDDPGEHFISPAQPMSVAGLDVEVYVGNGTPAITTVVLPGSPTITATGLDPISFLEAAAGFPVTDVGLDDQGEVSFTAGALPDGYDLVVPPTRMPIGSVEAWTHADDGDNGDGIAVTTGVHNPLLAHAQANDLQPIDINGNAGWLNDRGRGSTVHWQVSDTTWATVGGAASVDDAINFARAIEFVDEATWSERYQVERPDYPTIDEMNAEPQTAPNVTAEPTTLIVSRTDLPTLPEQKPVGCGTRPPIDEPLTDTPTAGDPDAALEAFLDTERATTLFDLGYRQLTSTTDDTHRYERYNDDGNLVTVIDVAPTDETWHATRLQASPC